MSDDIRALIDQVDGDYLAQLLRLLAKEPLPCRVLNVTLPGHHKSTLEEADDLIAGWLASWSYAVEREGVPVQAFRRDETKPLAHQYSKPAPEDPWYTARNLYAKKVGTRYPEELILALAHKDSQSWLGCAAGANDNAVGTAGLLEIARCLSDYEPQRSIWFLFCNEEHTPWTSVTAAERLAASHYDVRAVLNIDGIGAKSAEDTQAGKKTNVTRYTTPEGETLAELMNALNERYAIGLEQRSFASAKPGDDDGSFIKAGIPPAVLNIGSIPYAEPHYHTAEDVVGYVDIENVRLATQLSLAFLLHLDQHGGP